MLNAANRFDGKGNILVREKDIEMATKLWRYVSASVNTGLPPYLCDFYRNYILPAYKDRHKDSDGVTRMEISEKYYSINGEILADHKLRKDIIPALLQAKIIKEVYDKKDNKTKLIIPLIEL